MSERALQVIEAQHVTEYVPSVAVTIEQARDNFKKLHQVTRELMQKGVDYDTIPGTPKPTLLKPGAEHLLQFFGLGHKVQRVQGMEDWENGFFYYCYRITVFKARPMPDGTVYEQVISECEGSANSKEKRYRNQDVYTIVNTLQKMAIKRAMVGATLQATGTSGMFTQDLEDYGDVLQQQPRQPRQTPRPAASNNIATNAQLKAIFAKMRELGIKSETAKQIVNERYGISDSRELTKKGASDLIEYLTKLESGEETWPPEPDDNIMDNAEEVENPSVNFDK